MSDNTDKRAKATGVAAKGDLRDVNLKRTTSARAAPVEPKYVPVSAGPLDRVIDYGFNPTRDKIREVTIVDRLQGRLLPILDLVDTMWQYVLEVSQFRYDGTAYALAYSKERPIPPNLIDEYIYRVAQWQKSVAGMNLKSLMDLALAEMETRNEDEGAISGADAWKD